MIGLSFAEQKYEFLRNQENSLMDESLGLGEISSELVYTSSPMNSCLSM